MDDYRGSEAEYYERYEGSEARRYVHSEAAAAMRPTGPVAKVVPPLSWQWPPGYSCPGAISVETVPDNTATGSAVVLGPLIHAVFLGGKYSTPADVMALARATVGSEVQLAEFKFVDNTSQSAAAISICSVNPPGTTSPPLSTAVPRASSGGASVIVEFTDRTVTERVPYLQLLLEEAIRNTLSRPPPITSLQWNQTVIGTLRTTDVLLCPGLALMWNWQLSDTHHETGVSVDAVAPLIEIATNRWRDAICNCGGCGPTSSGGCGGSARETTRTEKHVIVGQGFGAKHVDTGDLTVQEATLTFLRSRGFVVHSMNTASAVRLYNQLVSCGHCVVALLHSRC
ncbi:hypothetical protein Pelo_18403 [Pelomyxa schiedti]|nr:hypothetical protein Pelo_18403 [Pelomyxa schiedti]